MTKLSRLLAVLALAASVTGAYAWDISITDPYLAGTNIMVVPPVVAAAELSQLPTRGTSVVVTAGAKYKIGSQIIVAAHSGTMTNQTVTTTAYYTNGLPVELAVAQWAATNAIPVYTNIYTVVAPITVPAVGLSGYDGSVRWYRARSPTQEDVRLQLTVPGGTLTLTDGSGSTLAYTAAATVDFLDFEGTLYGTKSVKTNCTAKAMAW
jgi:hypothetical protein